MLLRDVKQLKKLMVIQEVSQRQLATAAGHKSHAYMGRILRGEVKTVTPDVAARISHLFGVGVDDLFLVRAFNDTARNDRSHAA